MDIRKERDDFVLFINRYKGLSRDELENRSNVHSSAKNKNALIIRKIARAYQGEGFYKYLTNTLGVQRKTIQLKEDGRSKEAMSFPMFDYADILNETWEESKTREYLSSEFIFSVFQRKKGKNYFLGSFCWERPLRDIEGEVKETYRKVKQAIETGNVVKEILDTGKKGGKKRILNFPRESETTVCHVRPHGRNSQDVSFLPQKDSKTARMRLPKQSFWLNHEYLDEIVSMHIALLK